VREKLRNVARERNVDFGLILVKYGLERILYRLSRSSHRDVFILKGALLFELWTDQRYRPTRDADFLARGDNSPDRFAQIFCELCAVELGPDGLLTCLPVLQTRAGGLSFVLSPNPPTGSTISLPSRNRDTSPDTSRQTSSRRP
jgi:hypothetical protein